MLFRFSYAAEVAPIYDTAMQYARQIAQRSAGRPVCRESALEHKFHPPSRIKGLLKIGALY